MYVLGINCYYHDAAACLIKDGNLIAAAEEERFTREKHTKKFPVNAINFCLKQAGITINDVDHIGYSYNPWIRVKYAIPYIIKLLPKSLNLMISDVVNSEKNSLSIKNQIMKIYNIKEPKFQFHYLQHHLTHAASTFFVSEFKDSAILCVDACGEVFTTWYGYGQDNQLECIKQIKLPHSLGFVYSAVTEFVGFKVNDEWKMMGLAPYGQPNYYNEFADIIKDKPNGEFRIDTRYFDFQYAKNPWYSKKFVELFGQPRIEDSPIEKKYEDISSSIQKRFEEIIINMANFLYQETGSKNLCLAGGCALNSVANGKILDETDFKNIYIQPAANDAGTSLGSSYLIYHQYLKQPRAYIMNHTYTGPSFTNEEIEQALIDNDLYYKDYKEIEKISASLIARGKILGWFQGKMEFGPRALGNRSILADPRRPEMKDLINSKVKYRESFRPFAPSILEEDTGIYFENTYPSPFMLLVYKVKEDKRETIPAVTHVDNTGRLQTVSKKVNPIYWNLINEFKKLTGISVILNTSFNIKGEPIVCTPQDAINTFLKTGIDYLAIGNFLTKHESKSK